MEFLVILALSFVPMFIYAGILWWFDRYEKEPGILLAAAFLWGAIPSIILAIILELLFDIPIVALSPSQLTYELMSASVLAPLAEEGTKALAVLALLLLWRREIDSPLDGLIYGSLAGFGFAATENVLYLFGALQAGGMEGAVGLALLRSGLFGLNHAMYTGFTGLGIAMALEIKNKALRVLPILAGFAIAVLTHGVHNAFATFWGQVGGDSPLLIALIADWAGILILLLTIVWTFFLEQQRIAHYAEMLIGAQAIPATEVPVLRSSLRRTISRLLVLMRGDVRRWWRMGHYYHRMTEAAFAWHRANNGDGRAQERLSKLEQECQRLRAELDPGPPAIPG